MPIPEGAAVGYVRVDALRAAMTDQLNAMRKVMLTISVQVGSTISYSDVVDHLVPHLNEELRKRRG
jgi:hypothetical protein